MNIEINLAEGFKTECRIGELVIIADQPASKGGSGEFPSPYDYFISSIGLCAGYYVQSYCNTRKIETKGIKIFQNVAKIGEQASQLLIEITVELPAHFSEKDRTGILRSIDGCTVKKAILSGPEFLIKLI